MKKVKRSLLLFLCIILLYSGLSLCFAADEQAALVIGTAEGLPGNTVTVDVLLTSVNEIASGGFTITYNNSNLSVLNADVGDILSNCTTLINTEYSKNSIRVSFSGTTALISAGVLVSIQFKIRDDAALGNYALTASNVKFSDVYANVVSKDAENGSISVRGVSVFLSSASVVCGQGTDLDLCIQPPLAPCGGTLTLQYNPTYLNCGRITPVAKIGKTPITLQYSIDAQRGIINIAWMAGEPISDFGKLCSIHFETNKQTLGIQNISFANYRFVDSNGMSLPFETPQKATISVSERLESIPKLYFLENAYNANTRIVTLDAFIDGSDTVCAGNVKIQYDTDFMTLIGIEPKCTTLFTTPVLPETAEGIIQLVWASADPFGEHVCLVELKFQLRKTEKSSVIYSDIQLCDKTGMAIDSYDSKNIEVFEQRQWAKVSEVDTVAGTPKLNIILDESVPDSAKVLLAAYNNGRYAGLYSFTFEEIKKAKMHDGMTLVLAPANSWKLFLLADDSTPLRESVTYCAKAF